jgi:hypothetical protein
MLRASPSNTSAHLDVARRVVISAAPAEARLNQYLLPTQDSKTLFWIGNQNMQVFSIA